MNGRLLLIPPGALWISRSSFWAFQRSRSLPGTRQWRVERYARSVNLCLPGWHTDIFSLSPGTCSARQVSASEGVREWALFQGREMHFPCTVCSLFGLHCVSRGDAHGSGQDSGCGWLANSRFPQGPAEVSGLCQFLPAFYSQFQPASCPFDRLNLHQDSVQVFQRLPNWKAALFQLPYSSPLILPGSLWWRLTRQRRGLVPSYPSVLPRMTRCTRARIFLTACLPLNATMILVIESCWQSSLPWRNGIIG